VGRSIRTLPTRHRRPLRLRRRWRNSSDQSSRRGWPRWVSTMRTSSLRRVGCWKTSWTPSWDESEWSQARTEASTMLSVCAYRVVVRCAAHLGLLVAGCLLPVSALATQHHDAASLVRRTDAALAVPGSRTASRSPTFSIRLRRAAKAETRLIGPMATQQPMQFGIDPHHINSVRKSGRRHIMPEDLIYALHQTPTPGSRIFTNPQTGTRFFVNHDNVVFGAHPAGFK
jgi:hypothetical protein